MRAPGKVPGKPDSGPRKSQYLKGLARAEGIENPDSWNMLRRLGCDLAQGYIVSPPIPADQIPPFVRQANSLLQESDSTVRQIRALEELSKLRRT